ncbi:hypothetical protein [Sphingomonas chungangi]|uniref:hypothetical protein n=1 Tax=Sphingomonas chungangi TaxID=2683589 RepID=UPI0031B5B25E
MSVATALICAVLVACFAVIGSSSEDFCAAVSWVTSEPVSMLAPFAFRLDRIVEPIDELLLDDEELLLVVDVVAAVLVLPVVELVVVMVVSSASRTTVPAKSL